MGKTFFIFTPCSSRGMTPHMSYRKRGERGKGGKGDGGKHRRRDCFFGFPPLYALPFLFVVGDREKKFFLSIFSAGVTHPIFDL